MQLHPKLPHRDQREDEGGGAEEEREMRARH